MAGAEKGDIDDKEKQTHDPELDRNCCKVFRQFVVKEHSGAKIPESEQKLGKSTTVKNMITKAMGESTDVVRICEASVLSKLQNKTTKKISDVDFITKALPALAIEVKRDAESKDKKRAAKMDPTEMVNSWKHKIVLKLDETETKKKEDAVVTRLTDTKGYTGSHAKRFDESGKGKGKEGREDIVKNEGYVSGYTAKGTYGTKK